jgi:quinol monooxygenase YgiN
MAQYCGLIALARARPEKADELEAVLLSLVAPSRAEEGCLEYHIHRDANDRTLFVIYEFWRSRQIFDRHVASPPIQEFVKDRMTWLAQDFDTRWLDMRSPLPPTDR